jgi:hypothetical protein
MQYAKTILLGIFLSLSAAYGQTASDAFLPASDTATPAITSLTGASLSGSNVGATKQASEMNHSEPGGASVWYLWRPPTSGKARVTVTATGGNLKPLLGVYETTETLSNSGWWQGWGNDRILGDRIATTAVRVYAGRTYHIAVDGAQINGVATQGTFSLTVSALSGIPVNDDLSSATSITTDVETTGDTTNATIEAPSGRAISAANALACNDVWHKWVCPSSGLYEATTVGSSYDTAVGVHRFSSSNPTNPNSDYGIAANNDQRRFDSSNPTDTTWRDAVALFYGTSGQTYHFVIEGKGPPAANPFRGGYKFKVRPKLGDRPPNDDRASATPLGVIPASASEGKKATGNNQNATREFQEWRLDNAHVAGNFSLKWRHIGYGTVWHSFTVPTAMPVRVSTLGSDFDTLLHVWDEYGLLAGWNNDHLYEATETSEVVFDAFPGRMYYVQLSGDNRDDYLTHRGNYQITVQRATKPISYGQTLTWEYLCPATDPASQDADFASTWHRSTAQHQPAGAPAYDGPAFTPGTGLFGYGTIDGQNPPSTTLPRNTSACYFRARITVNQDMPDAEASILADDGAFVYVDGILRARVGVNPTAPDTFGYYTGSTASETASTKVRLGNISAGDHIVAVSVHNASSTSSDIGFDMELYQPVPRQPWIATASVTEHDDTGELQMQYVLAGLQPPNAVDVRLEASSDGGLTWTVPVGTASGAIGSSLFATSNNTFSITWNPQNEVFTQSHETTLRLVSNNAVTYLGTYSLDLSRPPLGRQWVNICYDCEAPITLECQLLDSWLAQLLRDTMVTPTSCLSIVRPWSMQAASIPQNARHDFESGWVEIFSSSIGSFNPKGWIRQSVGPPRPDAINVYFVPAIDSSLYGIAFTESHTDTCPDRFNRSLKGTVMIFYNAHRPEQSSSFAIGATLAHEIGHCLGLHHVQRQVTPGSSVMDYNWPAAASDVTRFSALRLPMVEQIDGVEQVISNAWHNELYHLLRWTYGVSHEGLIQPQSPHVGLMPGNYDTDAVDVAGCGFQSTAGMALMQGAVNVPLFGVQIIHISDLGVLSELGSFDSILLHDLAAKRFDIPSHGRFGIIASSARGLPSDIFLGMPQEGRIAFGAPHNTSAAISLFQVNGASSTPIVTGNSVIRQRIQPPRIHGVELCGYNSESVLLKYEAIPGWRYSVERSSDCNTWVTVRGFEAADSVAGKHLDDGAVNSSSRFFYRIKCQPPLP